MMQLNVYHLKNCDTCRKAVKALQAAGHELSLIDVRADGVSKAALQGFAAHFGWQTVLNTRSATWRSLDAADTSDMNSDKAIALILERPTLMKRPIIELNTNAGPDVKPERTIGWTSDVQAQWITRADRIKNDKLK